MRYWFIIASFLLGFISFSTSYAQNPASGSENQIILTNPDMEIELTPKTYVTRDPLNQFSWKIVLERHEQNIRGRRSNSESLNLGHDGAAHYMVFTIQNKTRQTDWFVDFGLKTQGRSGLLRSMYLYNSTTGAMELDGYVRPNSARSGEAKNLVGSSIPITIPPNKTYTYLFYMAADNALPVILPMKVKSEVTHLSNLERQHLLRYLIFSGFIAVIGFFIGMLFINARIEHMLFALYFSAQAVLYLNLDIRFFSADPNTGNIIGGIIIGLGILSIWMSRFFLDISWKNRATLLNSFFIFLTVLWGIGIYALFQFVHPLSPLRPVLIFAPYIITIFLLIFIALSKMKNGPQGSAYFLLSLIVTFIGFCISAGVTLGLLPSSKYLINAYWYCLLPHAFLIITATAMKFHELQQARVRAYIRQSQEAESAARLRQSKESADQQRLLRVLEREREVMEELREREAMRTEEMRKAKEAADEANRAKSAFLAVISHEIRTPMTGIMGMVRLILDTSLNKEQKEFATTIQESGNTMLALLNDILDFEKIETGKMDIEVVPFDLHRLLKSVNTLMSGRAKEHNIALELDIDPELPVTLEGDPTRMRQILLNLVGNAIKFTSEGSVTVIVKKVNTNQEKKVHNVYFGVKDTGIGISEEAQKNLFNPFAQADRSISRKFGGSGLGLAICKRLVEAMGGTINLNSKEGEGSTFYFTIEMAEAEAADVEASGDNLGAAIETQQKIKNLRILIAEDNEINQKVLTGFLEKDKHILDIVNDGEKAVQKAKNNHYDLVLMDVEMPLLKGDEATTQIREFDGPNKNTPIIAMTGNTLDEEIQRYREAGMSDHLAKPINPELLRSIIDKVSRGASHVDPDEAAQPAAQEDRPSQDQTAQEEVQKLQEPEQPAPEENDAEETAQTTQDDTEHSEDTPAAPKDSSGLTDYVPVKPQPIPDDTELTPDVSDMGKELAEKSKAPSDNEIEKAAASDEYVPMPPQKEPEEPTDETTDTAEIEPESNTDESATSDSPDLDPDYFDQTMLDGLMDSVGKDQLKELLDDLYDKAEELIDALKEASANNNVEELHARAHELKGMAGNFGFKKVSGLAKEIESCAKEEEIAGVNSYIDDLPENYQQTKALLSEWIEKN